MSTGKIFSLHDHHRDIHPDCLGSVSNGWRIRRRLWTSELKCHQQRLALLQWQPRVPQPIPCSELWRVRGVYAQVPERGDHGVPDSRAGRRLANEAAVLSGLLVSSCREAPQMCVLLPVFIVFFLPICNYYSKREIGVHDYYTDSAAQHGSYSNWEVELHDYYIVDQQLSSLQGDLPNRASRTPFLPSYCDAPFNRHHRTLHHGTARAFCSPSLTGIVHLPALSS